MSEKSVKKEVQGKDLLGLTIKINYAKTSVFFDKKNDIYIGLKDKENENTFLIEKEYEDVSSILKALERGFIFLFKGEKDVSEKFGGKAFKKQTKNVTKPIIPMDKKETITKYDEQLLKILYTNKVDSIIKSVINFTDLNQLKRLKQLELAGKNTVLIGRYRVLDAINDRIKQLEK